MKPIEQIKRIIQASRGWQLALLLPAMMAVAYQAAAQDNSPTDHKVRGKVYNVQNDPVVGAVVVEQGTANRAVTNQKGNFTINVTGKDPVLTITHIAMEPEEVNVGSKTNLDIRMQALTQEIDDVVVIGYNTIRKSDLTGSVAQLRNEDMEDRLVLSIEDALRGHIAGVTVGSSDGQPGEQLNIRIRGAGSINASSAPLYVVDGVPMEEIDLSPNEVDHLEILKDASGTAIYGSRGANGVVMVTTKKGIKGKASINVSAKTSLQTPVRLIEMADSYNYNLYRNNSRRNMYPAGTPNPRDPAEWDSFTDREGNAWAFQKENRWYRDYLNGKYLQDGATNTDWQRLMLQKSMTYDARVQISGGTDQTTYSIIGTFLNQDGMVLESGFQKYGLRANLEQQVNKRFKLGVNLSGNRSFQQGAFTNDVDGTTMNMLAQQPVKEPNYTEDYEDIEGESGLMNNNPWFLAKYVKKEVSKDNVLARLYLDHTIGRDFRLNISGSYTMKSTSNDQYYPAATRVGRLTNGLLRQNFHKNYDWLNENILYYTPKAKGKHKYDAMAGITFQEESRRITNTGGENFPYDRLQEWGLNYALTPLQPKVDLLTTRMMSLLGRANYTYDNRFLFTASIRADGSSRFGDNHKWGYFPSGAFAWRISREKFMKGVKPVSDLKLRLSAGVSGNTAIPAYQTLAMTSKTLYPMDGQRPSLGVTTDRVANPSLKWETSTQYDAGVDLSLFKNRITMTVDVYLKQTRDLLLVERVTGTSGYTDRWSNKGKVDNKGLEISLGANILRKKAVGWTTSYNMAFNRSKVRYIGESGEMILDASGTVTNNFAILREGMPIGLWYGYQTNGLYRSQAEIDALGSDFMQFAKGKDAMGPGFQKYVDQNGDGKIDEGDRVVIGRAEPKFTGGWQNNFTWKSFKLNVNTEFSYGRQIFNSTALMLERGVQTNNITKRYQNNYWRPTLYDSNGNVAFQGNEDTAWLPGTPRDAAYAESFAKDLYIEDGSYLRISNISLSYDLPSKLSRKIRAKSIRVTGSVSNVWVWTNYTGYDPDVNSVTGDYADLMPGLDNGSYPRSRVFTLGLNVTF